MRTMRPSGVYVLPVDVPAPLPDVFNALAGAAVAVPTCAGKSGHPVYLSSEWIERVLLPVAGRRDGRLDELIRPDALHVPVTDPSVTVNLNTPDDVATWLRANSHDR